MCHAIVRSGGRKSTDVITADTSSRSKFFNAVTYSADGACILAGGRSKYVCIYAVKTGALVKKFELSHNRYECPFANTFPNSMC
jgi:periodic tryptophan protein 2